MKIFAALTAGMIAITGVAAVPATAQGRIVVRERTVVRHAYGNRNRPRRVCTVRFRHGQRIRTCRINRY